MQDISNLLSVKVGIFWKTHVWRDRIFNEIKQKLEDTGCQFSYIENQYHPQFKLANGDQIYFTYAGECSRGHRFDRVIIEEGIDRAIIDNIIFPCCMRTPFATRANGEAVY